MFGRDERYVRRERARRAMLFALSKVEFMNINYDVNGALERLVGIGRCRRRRRRHHRQCRIAGVLRFSDDPIPYRRTADYRAWSSGKRLLMIFRVGSACSGPRQREPTVPELSVHYRRDFYSCSACPSGMAIIVAE